MAQTGNNNNTNNYDSSTDPSVSAYTAKTNARAGRTADAGLFFSKGALNAAASGWYGYANNWNATAGETTLAIKKGWQVAANVNVLGLTTLYGTVAQGFINGGAYEKFTKTRSKSLGYSFATLTPIGSHRIGLNYTRFDDKSLQERDADLFGVMYWYLITPKTRAYASYGYMRNHRSSQYALGDASNLVANPALVAGVGSDVRGAMVGFSQEF